MNRGKIILLNGASSSGKTTLANALVEILDEPYRTYKIDEYFHWYFTKLSKRFYPQQYPKNILFEEVVARRDKDEFWNKGFLGFNYSISGLSSAGLNIIVDTVLETKHVLKQIVDILHEFPVIFVGIHCDLEELERREKERNKKRMEGLAKFQYRNIHRHAIYDFEVNTTHTSAIECAKQIKEYIKSNGFSSSVIKELLKTL